VKTVETEIKKGKNLTMDIASIIIHNTKLKRGLQNELNCPSRFSAFVSIKMSENISIFHFRNHP